METKTQTSRTSEWRAKSVCNCKHGAKFHEKRTGKCEIESCDCEKFEARGWVKENYHRVKSYPMPEFWTEDEVNKFCLFAGAAVKYAKSLNWYLPASMDHFDIVNEMLVNAMKRGSEFAAMRRNSTEFHYNNWLTIFCRHQISTIRKKASVGERSMRSDKVKDINELIEMESLGIGIYAANYKKEKDTDWKFVEEYMMYFSTKLTPKRYQSLEKYIFSNGNLSISLQKAVSKAFSEMSERK